MLIQTRKRDEQIVIGEGKDRVVVKVVEITGNRVKLGFHAPFDVRVRRFEDEDREPLVETIVDHCSRREAIPA